MTVLNYSQLYQELKGFETLPGSIEELSVAAFKSVYESEQAAKAKGVVYIYLSEKPVPRLLGESRILYIGETGYSFRRRRRGDAKKHATSKANSFKYAAILEHYGAITIRVAPFQKYGENTKLAEGQLLWWYFQNHGEYPPLNYTKTSNYNDKIET